MSRAKEREHSGAIKGRRRKKTTEGKREIKSPGCVSMATSRGVRVHASVESSRQQAATHLEVSVHDIVLVDMIDALQDLTNAVAGERAKGTQTRQGAR